MVDSALGLMDSILGSADSIPVLVDSTLSRLLVSISLCMLMQLRFSALLSNILRLVLGQSPSTEFSCKKLKENNVYMFRVAAVNEEGQSPWAETKSEIKAVDPYGEPVGLVI